MRKEMGDRHEEYLIEVLGGKQSKGSGNQWHSPMDGRHNRYAERYAFAWDGKSTTTATVGVTLPMWEKAQEQAGGERPMLALRFYPTERPTVQNVGGTDLAVLDLLDLSALLVDARGLGEVLDALDVIQHHLDGENTDFDVRASLKQIIERYR
jgi:hypothetical protein